MHGSAPSGATLSLILAAAVMPIASAQDAATGSHAPVQTTETRVDEQVLVRGQRMSEIEFDLEDYVRDFLSEVVALPPGGGHARWSNSLCPGIYNLEPTAAQYVADRISLLARDVGLRPEEPGCSPDVMIIFTTDADDVAASMVENSPRLFRPGGPACCMQLGLDALDEFASSDQPVRWWHVSMPVDAQLGQRAIHLPQDGIGTYPIIPVNGPSRAHHGVVDRLLRVIIIVDATRLTGTTWQEIGDYLAVVSLAQINPRTDPAAYDSILNLFSNPEAYSGLTDWDRTYIQSLYEINRERVLGLQLNHLVSRMANRERDFAE